MKANIFLQVSWTGSKYFAYVRCVDPPYTGPSTAGTTVGTTEGTSSETTAKQAITTTFKSYKITAEAVSSEPDKITFSVPTDPTVTQKDSVMPQPKNTQGD